MLAEIRILQEQNLQLQQTSGTLGDALKTVTTKIDDQSSRSRKVRNLENDPRATLVLHDSRPGYEVCGASIVGSVEVVRAPGAQSLIDRVQGRYVATEAATDDPTARSFLESDDVALSFTPVSAFTWDHRAGEGSRILRSHGWARPLVTTDPRA